jgi:TolA-binding protein
LEACVAFYYRGRIKEKDMRLTEAIIDLGQATKRRCARFGEAQFALGLTLQKNRQYEDARKTYLEIQKLYPNTKLAEQALNQLRYLP